MRVYPRECGGTKALDFATNASTGLSPRVRGNPGQPTGLRLTRGSIPASAGEPRPAHRPAPHPRVYPRECGGTIFRPGKTAASRGLSPRVRGNRDRAHRGCRCSGSIPASAGEPIHRLDGKRAARVYPRECGGTSTSSCRWCWRRGLSPRVRGNPWQRHRRGRALGSIPASAGEPSTPLTTTPPPWVYPRECGGTEAQLAGMVASAGLSPRVRGNRGAASRHGRQRGSIPASAGEPPRRWPITRPRGVYPRECGGTVLTVPCSIRAKGLSPRVRGNPPRRRRT